MTGVQLSADAPGTPTGSGVRLAGGRAALRRLARNRLSLAGTTLVAVLVLASALGPLLWTLDPQAQDLSVGMQTSSSAHPLGTDQLGRDMLARILHGGRISLSISVAIVAVSFLVGGGLGMLCGYARGVFDFVIMRIMDMILSFPALLLALMISAARGPGVTNTIIAVTVPFIPNFARITRATVLSVREREFVLAARAAGVRTSRILTRYVLRNSMGPILVQASIGVGIALFEVAGLGYLGLGVQPPTPEWGAILKDSQTFLLQQPAAFIVPGAVIAAAILGFNLLGDALHDVLDADR